MLPKKIDGVVAHVEAFLGGLVEILFQQPECAVVPVVLHGVAHQIRRDLGRHMGVGQILVAVGP